MKWLFILLLLMNVGYFGWQFNQRLTQPARNPDPAPSMQNSDTRAPTLQLLSEAPQPLERRDSSLELRDLTRTSKTALALDQQQEQRDKAVKEKEKKVLKEIDEIVQEVAVLTEQPDGPSAQANTGETSLKHICRRIGPFSSKQQLSGFRVAHKNQLITYAERTDKRNVRTRYWVYLGPYKSARAAQLKVNQLLRKGVKDYWLIQGGNMENAISLGIYGHKESVKLRLQELKAINLSASVKPEHKSANIYWLDVELAKNAKFSGLPSGIKATDVACETIAIANGPQ